jgi:8-oxo-dGTP diphosphatase
LPEYVKPSVTVDICLYRWVSGQLEVALIQRGNSPNEPFPNSWAWPGGYVNEGESVEAAAKRELQEETGVNTLSLEEFGSMSEPNRDPRGWVISHCFMAKADKNLLLKAGDDAKNAQWFNVDEIPKPMAFDHEVILKKLMRVISSKK